ncbi:Homocysteine S-methyltransferase [Suillus plorans]|uniref:Homocysteine S-methyltransferase n=1 Tax=Suillus plorans TaxID=116603 RepID=A0A9P7AF18_9AGAM|nr:Homocysteine S-methyltransferase [Suillus plorans]KAG1787011.1 Homocysteine S-methyltransferase [Suillus plorans]
MLKNTILLSDGGLGTTLEDHFHLPISHTPLWSARIILDAPNTLQQAHLAFLEAGSRVLLTATYQAAFESFERAGYSHEIATESMRNAVHIADQARHQFCKEHLDVSPKEIHIALSLGPFGAVLAPMQDFGGIYPPPYGPRAYSDSEENTTSFGDDIEAKNNSVKALTRFHEDRLRVFTSDKETWDKVDFIAFETVPLVREVEAIRQAMDNMKETISPKPWWITATFPNGKYPDTRQPGGDRYTPTEAAIAMIRHDNDLPVPHGIGINCTALKYIPELLQEFERAMHGNRKLFLVLHPNGGGGFDLSTQAFREPEENDRWAEDLASLVKEAKRRGWNEIIFGGCCKTGPSDIKALGEAFSEK